MCCDCEAIDFDGEAIRFISRPYHSILKFMSTSLPTPLRPQKEVPIKDTIENTQMWIDLAMFCFSDHCSHVS